MAKKKTQSTAKPDEAQSLGPAVAAPVQAAIEEPTESVRHLFKPEDWISSFLAALFAGLVFYFYMAPEVTLQDSGELVTGAFSFGVPHPPGYPLWAFLGFVWSHFIFPFGNPAFRMGMLSVVTGALVVGVMSVMMTRGIRLLLHSLPWNSSVDEKLQHWIALTIGTSSSLLFGFNRGVWLWACVSEMRVLSVFSFVLIGCTFSVWTIQPQRRFFLYISLLLFGLSLANHQTIAVMAVPLAIGAFAVGMEEFVKARKQLQGQAGTLRILMTSLSSFWELGAAAMLSGMVGLMVLAWLRTNQNGAISSDPAFAQSLAAGALGVVLVITGRVSGWWRTQRILTCAGLFLAGVAFYFYMPLAASTNPPMNWGFASTKEGFLHAVTRGQYEKMNTANVFSEEFLVKIKVFVLALGNQYSWGLTILGLVTLAVLTVWWMNVKPKGRAWMVFVWAAFLATSLGLLTIINPKLDKQEQEITIKFFAPAHGFYAMLIGLGIATLLSMMAWKGPKGTALAVRLICIALLAMPLVTFKRNWSLCNLRGHDFGYLFGYLMFEPGGGYPPMDKNAVLYGGTDPGRFVPTYMIFCESRVKPKDRFRNEKFDRSDVYIITQNALADNTYMSYIRDHYDFSRPDARKPETIEKFLPWQRSVFRIGWKYLHRDRTYPTEPIFIPGPQDSNMAFQEYVQDVQSGRMPPSADISFENGRVQIQGVAGVMTINGILAKWIFERNKDKHSFYVEESYVIPWMYSYLRPAGIIMKIEKDPLPSPSENPKLWQDIVERDRKYWNKLSAEFLARPEFLRNSDAKKSFSKLRSAIAGLYAAKGLAGEAEYAYKQSLKLCPDSPEANFRLADLYLRLRRYAEARKLIEIYHQVDIYNNSALGFLDNIRSMEKDDTRMQELEKQMDTDQKQGRANLGVAIELAAIYMRLNVEPRFQMLTRSLLNTTNLPVSAYQSLGQICSGGRRWDLMESAMQRCLQLEPANFRNWIELGSAQLAQNRPDDAMASLRQAVRSGAEAARSTLRQDARFSPLSHRADFRAMIEPPREVNPFQRFAPRL